MNLLFNQRRYLIPFRGRLLPQIFCDTLVVGTGVAGLRAAIAAAEHGEVILLAKTAIDRSNTRWAQGGIAAAIGDEHEAIESHLEDTIRVGAGLCDPDVVHRVVSSADARITELREWGMRFDHDDAGELALGREGGHQISRVLHSYGDATGRELARTLIEKVRQTPSIRIFDQCFALDLLTPDGSDEGPALGAITYHPTHGLQMIWSWATILATGGAGQVFRETTNPAVATGDGVAMAWRAGATVADMEFMQFHPTTLYVAGAARLLITEAVRGEGAHLVDRRGERFMVGRHEMAELAPRDIVSRSIAEHLAETGETHVFLDTRHFKPGFFARRFPYIAEQLARFDVNPETDLIPVHPSAHYTIGGVRVDIDGRTTLPGLYACGEVACSGLNGANRLASNSLLEGLVMGEVTGRLCRECVESNALGNGQNGAHRPPKKIVSDVRPPKRGELDLTDVRSSLRSVMWRHLGVTREGPKMDDVSEMIDFWARYTLDKIFDYPDGWETQNLLFGAWLMCESARWRCESRGVHTRPDYPETNPDFQLRALWRRGRSEPRTEPAKVREGVA